MRAGKKITKNGKYVGGTRCRKSTAMTSLKVYESTLLMEYAFPNFPQFPLFSRSLAAFLSLSQVTIQVPN